MSSQHDRTFNVLNRLAKWRSLLAGWQLGTRPASDPECAAVRDHRESTLMLRVECTALASLLVEKKIVTVEEWDRALERFANQLNADLELKFPGVTATDIGLSMNPLLVSQWMRDRNWKP